MDSRMKRMFFYGAIIALLGIAPAGAQTLPTFATPAAPVYGTQEKKSLPSTPDYIAMTFYKLTRQMPDFNAWAQLTPAYKNAAPFEKLSVMDQQAQRMKESYDLLTLQEPLIVEMPVKLSAYSTTNHGYFIENFRADTFFPAFFADQAYAIVPQGIMDKQWLKVSDPLLAKHIDAAVQSRPDRLLMMALFMTPDYADKSAPVFLEGTNYWLMAATIRKMMLYDPGNNLLLWSSDTADIRDEKHQRLLDLYQ